MSKKKQTKDKSHYYPPEMMSFTLCSACLDVVLDQSEKAAELYEDIIECLSLPGCQETMEQIGEWIPDKKSIIKELVKESGYDFNLPPNNRSTNKKREHFCSLFKIIYISATTGQTWA